jgi:phosphatidylinositol 4-kinase type 2
MEVHPTLISKGSSGSYFARNSGGTVVGVFKPKDEEPYATRNPKWTKWIHRNLFPCFFGRACLIPNLSYVSEAAAYVLDAQLRCNLVPYTDVVGFSSKSFHYDYWDRRAFYRKKKPLPEKLGSFQVFLNGYKDATTFFRENPWPDQNTPGLENGSRKKRKGWTDDCRRGSAADDDENEPLTREESDRRRVFWTESLQQKFRQQLEKLVILDYIMRNTDRGLDNWMIRIDENKQDADIIMEPQEGNVRNTSIDEPYIRAPEHMVATSRTGTPLIEEEDKTNVRIGAIDNSLSWPWKHPDAVSSALQSIKYMLTIKVAKLSFWLVIPSGLFDWTTILQRNKTTLPTFINIKSMVG